MDEAQILAMPPYSLEEVQKKRLYGQWMTELTHYHQRHCKPYGRLLARMHGCAKEELEQEDVPMLPVGVFKDLKLLSIPSTEVFKTMTSSGTAGQKVSYIYLDAATARNQQLALARIGEDFWGGQRLPFLVIDSPEVLKNRDMFSARGAGILGFSIFATRTCYALDKEMRLDMPGIQRFLEQNQGKKILVFGFTYMIWKHFCQALEESGQHLDLSNAVLVHGGGWKKLSDQAVSPDEFKDRLQTAAGIGSVHNYYGMAEQTGSIYMECPCGRLHASIYSDIIIRRPADFSPCSFGEKGLIQVLSPLPRSYPGHSLLTEDEGVLLGEDDCACGRKGRYFHVTGRIRKAQIRGCSDTYEG